jgi:hypothetical protein
MKNLTLYVCVASLIFALSSTIAWATTVDTTPSGTGSLSYSTSSTEPTCVVVFSGEPPKDYTYISVSYSMTYVDPSGGSHTLDTFNVITSSPGYGLNAKSDGCPKPTAFPYHPTPKTFFVADDAYYVVPSLATGGVVSGEVTIMPLSAGWINPKYKIVDVVYSPPGANSTVTYTNDTVVGSSTSLSSSFSTAVGTSISITTGVSILGFSDKETTTYSDSYTEEQDTSSSIAVSQTTTNQLQVSGYSDPVNGLNHDYDYIYVWLNPILQFTFYTDQTGKDQVIWSGYGYDLNDTKAAPDMDVIGIQLGCLNGDFYTQYESDPGPTQPWNTCLDIFSNNFSRTWALENTDGSQPALTPTLANSAAPYNFCSQTGTDLYYICQADPFSNPSYGASNFPPPAGSYSSKDGRFTACNNSLCTATIDYEPGDNPGFSQAYSTTVSTSQGYKYTYTSGFSIESQFGYSPTGCSPKDWCGTFSTDTKDTLTYTWIDQFSEATNNSNGQTSAFQIKGPAEGYSGTDQFVLYQDNLYGTFMFYPGN